MSHVATTPVKATLVSALLCFACLLLPCAHSQPSGADRQALAALRARVETGDALAQFELGLAYSLGKFGLATNHVEAAKCFRKAAEQNLPGAQHNLGICYRDGQGVSRDAVEAFKWFRQAAELNHDYAQHNLGVCYSKGQGVAKDVVEAVKWFRKSAEQNLAEAQYNLALCHDDGQGVAKDAVEAVKWYHKAAEQNLALAQFNLAVCYDEGQGVAKDKAEAVKWYRKAADQNLAVAQFNLGVCHAEGQGVPKDYAEAVKWLRRAAEQNLAAAQSNLGVCYERGNGVTEDDVEAYKWWLLAAAQGWGRTREAANQLERQLTRAQLAEGQKRASDFMPSVVPLPDTPQGEANGRLPADLLAKAETGDAKAQNELGGTLYEGSQGVVRDAVEAVKWFRQAAEQNLPIAQFNLGVCYERGDGVAKYEAEAYKWYVLAAASGDTKAKRNASLLDLMLSPEEIATGKRRAQAWLEQRGEKSLSPR